MDTTIQDKKDIKEKPERKPLSKQGKVAITIAVLVAVITLCLGLFSYFTSTSSYAFYNKMVITLMPNEISDPATGLTFYVKENPKYDAKKEADTPLNAFTFYYKDEKGKEVDLENGVYYNKTIAQNQNVALGFATKAYEKLASVRTVLKVVMICVVVVGVALLIFLWYKSWCKRQDAIKTELYGTADTGKSPKAK